MPTHLARPLLHSVHLLTFLVLLVTGLLLFVPALREVVTGGYSLWIRGLHKWGGVAYLVLPAGLIAASGRQALRPAAAGTWRGHLQAAHVAVTAAMTLAFAVTGFVIWAKRSVPPHVFDGAQAAHDWLTYAALTLLALHLAQVGVAATFARLEASSANG